MTTLIIYNDLETIRFTKVDGDYSKFNNMVFNVGLYDEMEKECGEFLWDSDGNLKHDFTTDINMLENKEWDKIALITFVP